MDIFEINEILSNGLEFNEENGKPYITAILSDWRGNTEVKITIDDVLEYYCSEAHNIVSGCRTLAGYTGDWRNIDELAKECIEAFKAYDVEKVRTMAKEKGLSPKF